MGEIMNVNLRYSTISKMLEIVEKIKNGDDIKKELDELLHEEDYLFELDRYQKRISIDEFKDYLVNVPNLDIECIDNKDLKSHHENYVHLFDNLSMYKEKLNEFKNYVTNERIKGAYELARKGLPDDLDADEVDLVFTIGIGMSFGYVYKGNAHFDFLQLSKDMSFEAFFASLAHEIHHLLIDKVLPSTFTPEELFYLFFSAEGLAVKYCNNAKGNFSKALYDLEVNVGLDQFSWTYLNNHFDEGFDTFKEVLSKIKDGTISSNAQVQEEIDRLFMKAHTSEQNLNEIPKLKQTLLYSMGNDMYGLIHDVFGKEVVYKIIREPLLFPEYFNKAMTSIGLEKYRI